MPRIARGIIADIPYHIIHRGNNRQKIFFCEDDYKYFLSLIEEARSKHSCRLYTYALMPNHIHFLLESSKIPENLAKYIKLIVQKYAQHINKIHKRTGTLWEGRFKSSPVSRDNYLLACSRYIEMNPIRAHMVKDAEGYKWSSYRYKIGKAVDSSFIDLDPLYMDLGKNSQERQKNYQKLFKESILPQEWDLIRKVVNKAGIFGSSRFKEKIEKLLGRKFDIRDRGRIAKNN